MILLEFKPSSSLQTAKILLDPRKENISQRMKDEEYEIFVKYKDLEVNCKVDGPNSTPQNSVISYGVLFNKLTHQENFMLDLNGKANDTLVTLALLQDKKELQGIMFTTKFAETKGAASSAVDHEDQAELPRLDRIVTDKELMRLAGLLHKEHYLQVAVNLDLEFTDYDNIQRQNASLRDANFKMLIKWKYKNNGGKVRDLDEALNEAKCGAFSYKENAK